MRTGICAVVVVVAFCLSSLVFPLAAQTVEPAFKETKELMSLVRDAASLIGKMGETAFPEFKRGGSRWLQGDTYVFVVDLKGLVIVNPSRPELEGRNQMALKDAMGRAFIRSFIQEVTGYSHKNEGWTHYVWFKAGQESAGWKTSFVKYVKSPSGNEYVVGSGLYDMRMERIFVMDVVDEAVELIKKQGKAAFPQLRDPLGDFNYLTTYVFVIDGKGNDLVNPAFPGFEGQNVRDLKDYQGKPFIQEMMKGLEGSDALWMDYMWPKPRQAAPARKSSYVKRVYLGGEKLFVGSGVYLD